MTMRFIKKSISAIGLVLATTLANIAFAEVAIIVHPSNASTLSEGDIAKIYLGKSKKFPGGETALALDKPAGEANRVAFIKNVVGKSETQFKSYWSRLIFTGKGVPPKIISSDAEVVNLVSRNPDMIGFVDASSVSDGVKVIMTTK
ncbi:MAG: phosphate ABC transporter substrate-binding protein [Pseudomonadales bacterium]|nr:phosphate ABC transporter substrate-binding protein [Pseudomonadales bacterium]